MKKQKLSAEEANLIAENLELDRLKKWAEAWQDKPWSYALVSTLKKLPVIIVVALIFRMHEMSRVFSDPSIFFRERWWLIVSGTLLFIAYHRIVWNNYAVSYFLYCTADPGLPPPSFQSALAKRGRKVYGSLPAKYEFYRDKKYALMLGFAMLLPFLFFIILYLIFFFTEKVRSFTEFERQFDQGLLPLLAIIFLVSGALTGHGLWKGIRDQYHLLQKAKPRM